MSSQESKRAFGASNTSASSGERPALNHRDERGIQTGDFEQAGFSGTCESTSLSDWIQLVQMGRRGAVVTIRTHDGKMARLWCRAGDIIDASCDGLFGADAVYRALSWEGGKVSVDFRTFERAPRISIPTAALLLEGAYRKDSGVRALGHAERRTSSAPPSELPAADGLVLSLPSLAPARKRRRPTLRVSLGLVALIAGLALGIAISSWLSPARRESASPATGSEFLVRIEVEPAHAKISLDGKIVAVGRLSRTMARDGRTHEILGSADGYVSERLLFRDTPLQQRLVLVSRGDAESSERTTNAEPVRTPAAAQAALVSLRSRAVLPQPKQSSIAPRSDVVGEKPHEPTTAKANLQITEKRGSQIQVIDEYRPRIEELE